MQRTPAPRTGTGCRRRRTAAARRRLRGASPSRGERVRRALVEHGSERTGHAAAVECDECLLHRRREISVAPEVAEQVALTQHGARVASCALREWAKAARQRVFDREATTIAVDAAEV